MGDGPSQSAEEAAALVLGGVELNPRFDTVAASVPVWEKDGGGI